MKIVNLVENTEGSCGCGAEHGLCFYIETAQHKLLMDTGASDLLLKNARIKGIDLNAVDTVILSHGHYDHGGGLSAFAALNRHAVIYMHAGADGAYYSVRQGEPHRYVGLSETVKALPGIVMVEEDHRIIDEELELFAGIPLTRPLSPSNARMKRLTEKGMEQDDFGHEQCLVIRQGEQKFLFSGCAHHGICNVMTRFRELYGCDPDAVFSGFHMMRKEGYSEEDLDAAAKTAEALLEYDTHFYTGHCTGIRPYEVMKEIMKERLDYVHCGDELIA